VEDERRDGIIIGMLKKLTSGGSLEERWMELVGFAISKHPLESRCVCRSVKQEVVLD
jgi:hypothetical protein